VEAVVEAEIAFNIQIANWLIGIVEAVEALLENRNTRYKDKCFHLLLAFKTSKRYLFSLKFWGSSTSN
jgi:hypothetical protein